MAKGNYQHDALITVLHCGDGLLRAISCSGFLTKFCFSFSFIRPKKCPSEMFQGFHSNVGEYLCNQNLFKFANHPIHYHQ